MFGPNRGFSRMADSMEPCKMLWVDPCCQGNELWAMRGDSVAYRLVEADQCSSSGGCNGFRRSLATITYMPTCCSLKIADGCLGYAPLRLWINLHKSLLRHRCNLYLICVLICLCIYARELNDFYTRYSRINISQIAFKHTSSWSTLVKLNFSSTAVMGTN